MLSTDESVLLVLFCECCLIVVLNSVAASVLYRIRKRLASFDLILFLSLLVAHIFSGISSALFSLFFISTDQSEPYIFTADVIRHFCIASEIMFTINISIDRLVSVQAPFIYQRLRTKHFIVPIAVGIMLAGIFVTLTYTTSIGYTFGYIVASVGFLWILISNTLLYRSVRRHLKVIKSTIVDRSKIQETQRKTSMKQREMKSLKICILISISFLSTWYPLSTYRFIVHLENTLGKFVWKDTMFEIFAMTNAIWDVAILYYLNRHFREFFWKRLWSKHRIESNWQQSSTCLSENKVVNLQHLRKNHQDKTLFTLQTYNE